MELSNKLQSMDSTMWWKDNYDYSGGQKDLEKYQNKMSADSVLGQVESDAMQIDQEQKQIWNDLHGMMQHANGQEAATNILRIEGYKKMRDSERKIDQMTKDEENNDEKTFEGMMNQYNYFNKENHNIDNNFDSYFRRTRNGINEQAADMQKLAQSMS